MPAFISAQSLAYRSNQSIRDALPTPHSHTHPRARSPTATPRHPHPRTKWQKHWDALGSDMSNTNALQFLAHDHGGIQEAFPDPEKNDTLAAEVTDETRRKFQAIVDYELRTSARDIHLVQHNGLRIIRFIKFLSHAKAYSLVLTLADWCKRTILWTQTINDKDTNLQGLLTTLDNAMYPIRTLDDKKARETLLGRMRELREPREQQRILQLTWGGIIGIYAYVAASNTAATAAATAAKELSLVDLGSATGSAPRGR